MPRYIPPLLAADLKTRVTTLCCLLKVSPKLAATFGMCSTNANVTYDDGAGPVTYLAASGFDPSDIDARNDLSVNNSQANALLAPVYNVGMTQDGVTRGDYDDADFVLYLINYMAPDHGHVILQSGRIGQVKLLNGALCQIELRSLTDILKQNNMIGLTSITDRAMLGDDHNKLPLHWYAGTVASVGAESDRVFASAVTPGSGSVVGGGLRLPMPGGDLGQPGDWVIDGGGMYGVTDDPRYVYLECNDHETTAHRDIPIPSQVADGDNLTLSWLTQGVPGAGRTIQVWMEFPGTGAANVTNGPELITGDWVQHSVSAPKPAGATTMRITVQFEPQGSKDGMNLRGFNFTDDDYVAGGTSDVSVLGVPFFQGDGTTTTAQLLDTSGNEITSGFDVQTITVDGTALDPADWSISASGLVTFTTPPASGAQVDWSGTLTAQPSGYFSPGVVHWDSGWNIGLEREVESYDATTGTVTLAIPCPFAIRVGDAFRIRRDYDQSWAMAIGELKNGNNFRGEPYLPRGNATDIQAPTPKSA
jgi:hypothetical protein